EADGLFFVFPREIHGRGRRRHTPPAGHVEPHLPRGRALFVVADLDSYLAFDGRRIRPTAGGSDRHVGRHTKRQPRHHRQLHPFFAFERRAFVTVLHG